MKNLLIALIIGLSGLSISVPAKSEEIFRIQIGKDPQSYSDSELKKRLGELERAVWQLQQRVFQLEANKAVEVVRPVQIQMQAPPAPVDSWICKVKAMGETYTGTGGSKALAEAKSIESCKIGQNGSGFFCKDVQCSQ